MTFGVPPPGGFCVRTQPTCGFGEARPMVSAASLRARCMKTSSWVGGALSGMALRIVVFGFLALLGTPSPLGGYFGRKILLFNTLQGVSVCKILAVKGLRLKYSIETS